MTIWRLEWLRLVRTRRLLAILAAYVFFGLTGPLTARYLSQIINRLGGADGVKVEFPEPRPVDGIIQFISNATQIGLLVVVLVAASALAFDSRREMAVFLRTRVLGVSAVLVPTYVINAAAAAGGFAAGGLAAWYETAVLLGPLPAGRMVLGIALGGLFLVFAVALTAFVSALVKGVLAIGGITLAVLLGLAIASGLGTLGRWLPTSLAGAMSGLAGVASPADYLPAAIITFAATAAALAGAIVLSGRREW